MTIPIWSIWYRRNKLVHEGAKLSLHKLLGFIRGCDQDLSLNQEKIHPSRSYLVNELWRPPDIGVTKLNFDAAFRIDSRVSTTTVIARDSIGEIIGAETYLFTDVCDACVAEARACERVLRFAIERDFRCITVKGDSLTAIKSIEKKEKDKSVLRPIIHQIRFLEECLDQVTYSFMPRSVNRLALTWRWKAGRDRFLVTR
ncbi:hypothetical protein J1N35_044604 [Gossypium stocksii]|uniref:RNase H type-1 domain-containing protein n=1 Tax=Gossypium stocksii TaxID=47602 RepID=A0A9D3U9Q1_9ROSI|nr:hypothetical protein J1N35_044604 [Gossypium stocksii]